MNISSGAFSFCLAFVTLRAAFSVLSLLSWAYPTQLGAFLCSGCLCLPLICWAVGNQVLFGI